MDLIPVMFCIFADRTKNIINMASIQDIRTLETRVTDIVDDYIQQQYNEDDVLAIGRRCGKITLKADAKGGKCVFSSEWNAYSQKTYFSNFGDMPFGYFC